MIIFLSLLLAVVGVYLIFQGVSLFLFGIIELIRQILFGVK